MPKEYQQRLEQFETITAPTGNYKSFRRTISEAKPPCIPFLGSQVLFICSHQFVAITLKDLTFTEDGNPDFIGEDSSLINFFKRRKIAEIILPLMQYQQIKYVFFVSASYCTDIEHWNLQNQYCVLI